MLHIIWRFRAKPERVAEFRQVYGNQGSWAKLFQSSPEYRGTKLLEDVYDPLEFIVIDEWANVDSLCRFKDEHGRAYELLDQQCLELTDNETLIGNFISEVD